jgi:hypothetical protein|tara:strand:+ start:1286 stop:1897 length:612 start_codon:yes stop_codon:yes gene_type:complete
MTSFNLTRVAGGRRIRDRGIKWIEHYHERSAPVKKRFERELGPNSYLRWEGHDYTTNGDYFLVVGPAMTKELKKRFFSGIKRLPENPKAKVYAPSGEYFSTLHGALSHAAKKWGLPFPRGNPDYTLEDLTNIKIPRHVKGSVEDKIYKLSNHHIVRRKSMSDDSIVVTVGYKDENGETVEIATHSGKYAYLRKLLDDRYGIRI